MDLNSAISRAQKLMLDEGWNRQVERRAAMERGKGGGMTGSGDLAGFEQMAFGSTSSSRPRQPQVQMIDEQRRTPNIPQNIIDSFASQPPIGGDPKPAFTINEIAAYQQQQQQQQAQIAAQNAGINYDLIKYIVNECIKENLGMLNESSAPQLRGMRISAGNVIQLLDTKGNLYEGQLVLKKKKS